MIQAWFYWQIRVPIRNRVVENSLLSEIWPEMFLHKDYHKFVGELILDENFRSVNNKTSIDPHNPFWEKLLAAMNEKDSEHRPERITRTEENIKSQLRTRLEGLVTESSAILIILCREELQ